MKRSFRALGVLALASGLALTGCKKDIETSDLTLDLTKKATVTAYFYAETNLQSEGNEYAPNGTKVIVSIPNSSFNPTATGNWTDTASIKDGKVTVTVPATNAGVTVTFYPVEFIAKQKQVYGYNVNEIEMIYKLPVGSALAGVKPEQSYTHQATYTNVENFKNFTEKVSMTFEIKAQLKEGDPNTIVRNIPISVYCITAGHEWYEEVTTNASGLITVNVPKNQNIYFKFYYDKDMNVTPTVTKKYSYSLPAPFAAPSTSTPVIQSLNFDGQLWAPSK